ncbi:MAG: tryptophan synthase subunit alpha [Candidatus Calescibacterium sp.]|nr:tryptophan synthase subunit alpha [Candidatus Calescibacterium sp.]MCX7733213.1 tryptophan synthase subunit alpha [bacterium]MDW8086920.1 tryptophan synthase subunit alpha [Candidatus Calescibacterium sp.]
MKLCTYYTCGFPDMESSFKIIRAISEFSDYIEIGIPFSDPIADGPTIQLASQKSLENGFRLKKAFPIINELSKEFPTKKYLIMTYYNIIFQRKEDFIKKSKESGVWGIVVPDLPPGEDTEFEEKLQEKDIKTIFFVSPTTPKNRMKYISRRTTGFIYYITVKGVTGERNKLPEDLVKKIQEAKKITKKEVFAGFGISNAEQVKELKGVADGVIIGSAIIKKVIESGSKDPTDDIKRFLGEIKENLV